MRSSRPSITKPRKERVRADLAPLLLPLLLHHLLLLLLPPPLLLPVQKFRLPGKSWDPIIRVSSIVMQITITNRRQGRSPGRYRGKRISVGSLSLSLSLSLCLGSAGFTREAESSSTWHPGASRTSLSIEEARKRCRSWQLRVRTGWSRGSSTTSSFVSTFRQ